MTRMQLLCSTLVALHLLLIVIPVASRSIETGIVHPTVEKFFLIYSDFARGYLSHNRSSDELTIDRRGQLHHANLWLMESMSDNSAIYMILTPYSTVRENKDYILNSLNIPAVRLTEQQSFATLTEVDLADAAMLSIAVCSSTGRIRLRLKSDDPSSPQKVLGVSYRTDWQLAFTFVEDIWGCGDDVRTDDISLNSFSNPETEFVVMETEISSI